MSQPLQPVTYQEFDMIAQADSSGVIELAQRLATDSNWAMQVLSQANLDDGLLLGPATGTQPGGSSMTGYAPMTAEQMEYYRVIFGKLAWIATLLLQAQGNEPPAVDVVRPWSRQGVAIPSTAYMPPTQPTALVRRY